MITIHKASFVSEPSQRRPRKQQQHRLSLPTCTKQIPAKCHTNELKKTGIANTKAPRRELFITHTRTCNERNHKCQTEGHLQPKLQATLTTWVEADMVASGSCLDATVRTGRLTGAFAPCMISWRFCEARRARLSRLSEISRRPPLCCHK